VYWFEFFQGDKRLGVGFFLTRCYALTALHCLRGIAADDDVLDIWLTDGDKVQGRVHRRSIEADLALIDVPRVGDTAHLTPNLGRAGNGEEWRNPYRPSNSHVYLSGKVAEFGIIYRCVGGANIEAVQLECNQPIGDYAGYSGSPVELNHPGGDQMAIGILLEQYPDQFQAGEGFQRASNVLFAATLAEAYRRFDCFDTEHLVNVLNPSSGNEPKRSAIGARTPPDLEEAKPTLDSNARPARRSTPSPRSTARKKLEALRDWKDRGLLNEQDVVLFRRQVAQRFIEDVEG
jgi:hypothetical protein